jgi:hypothetical protein
MKISIDRSQFAGALTAYQFEAKWRKYANPASRLEKAEIGKHEDGKYRVYLYYEREAHALTLREVADFLFCERVLVGKVGRNQVLCMIKKGV